MRLTLVRHGQTPSNVLSLLDTAAPGADLTDLGREQAAALPRALGVDRTGAPVPSVVFASTRVRAQQTAAPLAAYLGVGVQVLDGLHEVSAGDLEMLGDPDSIETYQRTVFRWSAGDVDLRMPGGESGAEVYARYDAALAVVAATGAASAVVVSHGAVIRSWCASRAGVPLRRVVAHGLANTGAVVLEGDPTSGWTAISYQDEPLLGGPRESRPAGQVREPQAALE